LNDGTIQTQHSKGFDTVSVQYQPIYFCRLNNTNDKGLTCWVREEVVAKNKVNQCNTPAHKTHGQKKSQNDFWLFFDMNLDFDLAAHFNNTVWRDLIEITHWTGITLH